MRLKPQTENEPKERQQGRPRKNRGEKPQKKTTEKNRREKPQRKAGDAKCCVSTKGIGTDRNDGGAVDVQVGPQNYAGDPQ